MTKISNINGNVFAIFARPCTRTEGLQEDRSTFYAVVSNIQEIILTRIG